ncbi:arginine N-succinyltransferase [Parvularcula flava]|uniref:Arginine N-succinyltransferase n=1 Tax=Aquisalinus luteolus TaxID=1566827 RepID=A0A8J3A0C9_9PROT|nr:arginine N-succinyltransferase [Aquisalinus luteolus]NHK26487.1 arginine N-succinyltransferase [Aquisalinus luteolus]GGH92487.1 arginine N-succinyltransferase [Aquisalinus luteolus]
MVRVRPAEQNDLPALMELAGKTGRGMTTVPQSERTMQHRIYLSQEAFARPRPTEKGEIFFLVLEDDSEVIGMACIFTHLGHDRPFYSYRISHISSHSPELELRTDANVLTLVNDFHGYTEIGTLFVDPDKRGGGVGRLLSFSRFMLMAANPGRFGDKIMAEIRGWADENGDFPFWEHVARKFFHLEFDEADKRSANDFRFIADLMPKYPIYADLLPKQAQEAIGKPHDSSRPAMELLMRQGFHYENLIDIFDAGPSLQARIENITTIRNAERRRVEKGKEVKGDMPALVAKIGMTDFACISAHVDAVDADTIILSQDQIDELGVKEGEEVLVTPVKGRKS